MHEKLYMTEEQVIRGEKEREREKERKKESYLSRWRKRECEIAIEKDSDLGDY